VARSVPDSIPVYTTCLYCARPLPGNDVIEHQPVGQRLAFDTASGRLWVICLPCSRWNLVPFDQRLEAIDDCERQYREARARYSTGNIGLARINERLELVRIGPALKPEFAAWRYGRILRRRRWQLTSDDSSSGSLAGTIHSILSRTVRVLTLPLWDSSVRVDMAFAENRTLRDPWTDRLVPVPVAAMAHATLVLQSDLEWALEIPYRTDLDGLLGADPLELLSIRDHPAGGIFRGGSLLPTLGRTSPVLERRRPSADVVNEAIRLLEVTGGEGSRLFSYVAGRPMRFNTARSFPLIDAYPEVRLAMEMAAHEDTERRALEGELKLLEREWREADRLAKITDDLALGEID
jgi:hypothetical protein